MPTRQRYPKLPIAIAAGLLLVIGLVMAMLEPEPLTNEEILDKSTWTKEELIDTMAGREIPNRDVNRHLRSQLENYSEAERKTIVTTVIQKRIDKLSTRLSTMEPEKKTALLGKMYEQAKKQRERVENMSKDEKEKMKEQLNSDRSKQFRSTIRQELLNRLSPDARRDMAPIMTEWLQTIESI